MEQLLVLLVIIIKNSEINESITDGNNIKYDNTITDKGDSSNLENNNKRSKSDSPEEEEK